MRKRSHRASPRPKLQTVFTAKIVRGEDGWFVAYSDELPGCVTQGRTIREARENFAEALAGYLETLAEIASKGRKVAPSKQVPVRITRFALKPV